MLGEEGLVAPNDPAYAGIDETEFVAGGVYRLDAGSSKFLLSVSLDFIISVMNRRWAYHFDPPA